MSYYYPLHLQSRENIIKDTKSLFHNKGGRGNKGALSKRVVVVVVVVSHPFKVHNERNRPRAKRINEQTNLALKVSRLLVSLRPLRVMLPFFFFFRSSRIY